MIRTLRAHQSSCVPEAYTVQLQSVHPRIAHLGLWTLRQPIAHREKLRQTARSPGDCDQLQMWLPQGGLTHRMADKIHRALAGFFQVLFPIHCGVFPFGSSGE